MTPFLICMMFIEGGTTQEPIKTRADETPVVASAIITDINGNPLGDTVPLGSALRFSARQSTYGKQADGKPVPGSVKWYIEPENFNARKWIPVDSLGMEGDVPTGLVPAEITITLVVGKGDTVDIAKIKVKCGEGDLPPPGPGPKPDPQPDPPVPPQPTAQKLHVVIVHNTARVTPDESIVLGDARYWDAFKARGLTWRRFDSTDPDPLVSRIKTIAVGASPPLVAILDESKSTILTWFTLPRETTTIDNQIKRFTTR